MRVPLRVFALAVLALLVGCGGGGPGTPTGTLVMSMTDGPFPATEDCLTAARVDIDKVEVRAVEAEEPKKDEDEHDGKDEGKDDDKDEGKDDEGKDEDKDKPKDDVKDDEGGKDDDEGDAKDDEKDDEKDEHDGEHEDGKHEKENPWIEVPLAGEGGVLSLNLLELRAGLEASLALGEIPAGTYDEIRLHVAEAVLEFADGSPSQPFKIPSGMSSGIKIKVEGGFTVAGGGTTVLVLDFDLGGSFHTTGEGCNPTCDDLKSGETKVIFHPVLHAHVMVQDSPSPGDEPPAGNESGVIMGIVYNASGSPVSDVEVSAFAAGTAVDEFTPADAATYSSPAGLPVPEGSYALYLLPGTYDIYVRSQSDGALTLALSGVVLGSGETVTGQDLTLP
jgi:hypothetical protein